MEFMRDDEAVKTMSLFNGASEIRGISRRALKNWVVNISFHMDYKNKKIFLLLLLLLVYVVMMCLNFYYWKWGSDM